LIQGIKVRIAGNRLIEARYSSSPHCDDRPDDEVSLIVVHGISLPPGEFGGREIEDLFLGHLDTGSTGLGDLKGLRVSSHLLIRRSGEIIQFVDFDKRAWHAGESEFLGRTGCNDFSVGIELEGTDTIAYEDVQYQQLTAACQALIDEYPIARVCGHCDIAPGRKTDPGPAFRWEKLEASLGAELCR